MEIKNKQVMIYEKYNTEMCPISDISKVGVTENVKQTSLYPTNGLRHQSKDDTSGWCIWVSENLSNDENFFLPLYTSHL